MIDNIKEFLGSLEGVELVVIFAIIALLAFAFLGASRLSDERQSLYDECIMEGNISPFECKAMAHEMTRVYN